MPPALFVFYSNIYLLYHLTSTCFWFVAGGSVFLRWDLSHRYTRVVLDSLGSPCLAHALLWMDPRASCILGNHSANWAEFPALTLVSSFLLISGFSAPSSGQTLLAQTKHLLIDTGHFGVSYTNRVSFRSRVSLWAWAQVVWVGPMFHSNYLQLPQSFCAGLVCYRAGSIQKAGLSKKSHCLIPTQQTLGM